VLPQAAGRSRKRVRRAQRRPQVGTLLAVALVAVLLVLAVLGFVALARDGGEAAGEGQETPQQQPVQSIPNGETPAEDARNLADWLRENAGP
jgi:cytochrome c-type biogenesis protein CcmH/NrfG